MDADDFQVQNRVGQVCAEDLGDFDLHSKRGMQTSRNRYTYKKVSWAVLEKNSGSYEEKHISILVSGIMLLKHSDEYRR